LFALRNNTRVLIHQHNQSAGSADSEGYPRPAAGARP
jgi:hypothetical protein